MLAWNIESEEEDIVSLIIELLMPTILCKWILCAPDMSLLSVCNLSFKCIKPFFHEEVKNEMP